MDKNDKEEKDNKGTKNNSEEIKDQSLLKDIIFAAKTNCFAAAQAVVNVLQDILPYQYILRAYAPKFISQLELLYPCLIYCAIKNESGKGHAWVLYRSTSKDEWIILQAAQGEFELQAMQDPINFQDVKNILNQLDLSIILDPAQKLLEREGIDSKSDNKGTDSKSNSKEIDEIKDLNINYKYNNSPDNSDEYKNDKNYNNSIDNSAHNLYNLSKILGIELTRYNGLGSNIEIYTSKSLSIHSSESNTVV